MSNRVFCAICQRPVPVEHALRVELSRVANVWLCRLCTEAVAKALERDIQEPPAACLDRLREYLATVRRKSIRRIK